MNKQNKQVHTLWPSPSPCSRGVQTRALPSSFGRNMGIRCYAWRNVTHRSIRNFSAISAPNSCRLSAQLWPCTPQLPQGTLLAAAAGVCWWNTALNHLQLPQALHHHARGQVASFLDLTEQEFWIQLLVFKHKMKNVVFGPAASLPLNGEFHSTSAGWLLQR